MARAFPQVSDFIIGNEPNLIRFWSPTYNAVKNAIARGCTGPQTSWTHSTTVDGAADENSAGGVKVTRWTRLRAKPSAA